MLWDSLLSSRCERSLSKTSCTAGARSPSQASARPLDWSCWPRAARVRVLRRVTSIAWAKEASHRLLMTTRKPETRSAMSIRGGRPTEPMKKERRAVARRRSRLMSSRRSTPAWHASFTASAAPLCGCAVSSCTACRSSARASASSASWACCSSASASSARSSRNASQPIKLRLLSLMCMSTGLIISLWTIWALAPVLSRSSFRAWSIGASALRVWSTIERSSCSTRLKGSSSLRYLTSTSSISAPPSSRSRTVPSGFFLRRRQRFWVPMCCSV
mmetsp:Transcript_72105/g.233269  ORF Transcript_72105/g.233269 Transcript_72105/m.233269 type:complete len:274 (-) Transcript_72105:1619-2440(-)